MNTLVVIMKLDDVRCLPRSRVTTTGHRHMIIIRMSVILTVESKDLDHVMSITESIMHTARDHVIGTRLRPYTAVMSMNGHVINVAEAGRHYVIMANEGVTTGDRRLVIDMNVSAILESYRKNATHHTSHVTCGVARRSLPDGFATDHHRKPKEATSCACYADRVVVTRMMQDVLEAAVSREEEDSANRSMNARKRYCSAVTSLTRRRAERRSCLQLSCGQVF